MRIRELEPATYAVALHEGPLDEVGDCCARLLARIANEPIEGRRWDMADPPSMERYLCDPRRVRPEEMRTEILMPVTASNRAVV